MKIPVLLSTLLFLVNRATAWHGSMAASGYFDPGNGIRQLIYLTDYTTGSTWQATLFGGFNGCTTNECAVFFVETSPGGYGFEGYLWRTNDGCHNIDFAGALDAHHGYCCGSLPCELWA
ncbi:hypothetical protein BJX62DRAFT_181624 [Aspergillus germanicus]